MKRSSKESHGLELAWYLRPTGGDDIEGRPKSSMISLTGNRVGGLDVSSKRVWKSLVGNQLRLETVKGVYSFSQIIQVEEFAILTKRNERKKGGGGLKIFLIYKKCSMA